jgi:hypothetical protein
VFRRKWFVPCMVVVLAVLLITHAAAMAEGQAPAINESASASAVGIDADAPATGNVYSAPTLSPAFPVHSQPLSISGGSGGINLPQ